MADRKKIGLRDVRALEPDSEIWDASVAGFGARRQRSPAVAYQLMYRTLEGRQRRYTIGRHGSPWTPDTARQEALRILGLVVRGQDPAAEKQDTRRAQSVSNLCDAYVEDMEAGRLLTRRGASKKSSTIGIDKLRIERHIKPALGKLSVKSVTRHDVEAFMHAVAAGDTAVKVKGPSRTTGGRGTATRTVGLLGAIFSYAVKKGIRPDNPCIGVTRFAEGRRERRLEAEEYKQLGSVARMFENRVWPPALAAVHMLALTGWRRGEVLDLQWSDISLDRRTAMLPDTKTGKSMRPLSLAACDLLSTLHRSGKFVFPSMHGDQKMNTFRNIFVKLITDGELPPDITPHVLRHSFASIASDLGYAEPTIAALLGHVGRSMTSRYVHSADAVLLAAADAVASKIDAMMASQHG